jgi:hypothetical protein
VHEASTGPRFSEREHLTRNFAMNKSLAPKISCLPWLSSTPDRVTFPIAQATVKTGREMNKLAHLPSYTFRRSITSFSFPLEADRSNSSAWTI